MDWRKNGLKKNMDRQKKWIGGEKNGLKKNMDWRREKWIGGEKKWIEEKMDWRKMWIENIFRGEKMD